MRVTGSNADIDIDELMEFVDGVENTFGRVDDFVNRCSQIALSEADDESEDD